MKQISWRSFGLGVLVCLGVFLGVDMFRTLLAINEPEPTGTWQTDMALHNGEFFPKDVERLELLYRNVDTAVDAFSFKSGTGLDDLLKQLEKNWEVEEHRPGFAYLVWNSDAHPWKGESFTAIWRRGERYLVCRTSRADFLNDPWFKDRVIPRIEAKFAAVN